MTNDLAIDINLQPIFTLVQRLVDQINAGMLDGNGRPTGTGHVKGEDCAGTTIEIYDYIRPVSNTALLSQDRRAPTANLRELNRLVRQAFTDWGSMFVLKAWEDAPICSACGHDRKKVDLGTYGQHLGELFGVGSGFV